MDGRFTILSFLLSPPPDADDVNSVNAGAARNCRRGTTALTFKVGLCPFSFCVTSSKMSFSFTWEVGIDGCLLDVSSSFFFLRIVKLPFHKIRLTIEEFYLRILFEELK